MPLTCASGARVSISAISAPQPAATTTPVNSSRVAVHAARSPPRRARPNTSSVDTNAPANAAGAAIAVNPASMAASAPTAAPPEMPSTYGSASGLRSNTCIIAPASASRPPEANAASARGRRRSRTIAAPVSSPPVNPRAIAAASTGTLPTASASARATMAASARPDSTASVLPAVGSDESTKGIGVGRGGRSRQSMGERRL